MRVFITRFPVIFLSNFWTAVQRLKFSLLTLDWEFPLKDLFESNKVEYNCCRRRRQGIQLIWLSHLSELSSKTMREVPSTSVSFVIQLLSRLSQTDSDSTSWNEVLKRIFDDEDDGQTNVGWKIKCHESNCVLCSQTSIVSARESRASLFSIDRQRRSLSPCPFKQRLHLDTGMTHSLCVVKTSRVETQEAQKQPKELRRRFTLIKQESQRGDQKQMTWSLSLCRQDLKTLAN